MNPTNKKVPVAKSTPHQYKPPAANVAKPMAAQLKTAAPTPAVKRPVAPPVYRPQPLPKVLQTKKANTPSAQPPRKPPTVVQQHKNPPARTAQRTVQLAAKRSTPAINRPTANRRSNTVQAMFVDPMPPMEHQWKPGIGVVFDPNCGWYCQMSAIRHWVSKLKLKCPDDVLPKTSLFAFSPWNEGVALSTAYPKPASAAAWENRLTQSGPMVVAGKLGGADWGVLGGVGHFVLIVGADAAASTLSYLDPLQGNTVKTEDFQHVQDRITSNAYGINVNTLRQLCEAYEEKLRSKWLEDVSQKWKDRDGDSINNSKEGTSFITNDML